jgi:predicted acetyltransferase
MLSLMAEVLVRQAEERDLDGYYDVRSLTYNNGDPVPQDKRVARFSARYVAEQEGEIRGAFNVLPFSCTRGEALLRCGGVAGVAVLPHQRRSGVGRAMMEWYIRQAREEGVELASLYGFSERYYRMFGYEVCGKRVKITCPADKLPRLNAELPLRKLTPTDWRELDPCLQSFGHQRSGVSYRSEALWERVLSENRPLTVYAAGEPVEAYVVVSHKVDFFTTDHISEFVWSSRRGYESMFEVLRAIGINKTALSWYEPSDSPFLSRFLDTGVETQIERPIMFRACDVPGALEKIARTSRPVPDEPFLPFSVRVHDALIPENEGPWGVTAEGVEKTDEADFELDVRHFAQALLGDPSLADLARNDLLQVSNPGGLKAAMAALPPSAVYCPEFF